MDQGQKKNKFAVTLAIVSAIIFILGILAFSGKLGGNKNSNTTPGGNILIWGTLPELEFRQSLDITAGRQKDINITYAQVDSANLKNRLAEAIALDVAPDIIVSDLSSFYGIQTYTQNIPYTSYPEAGFRQTFTSATYDLLQPGGVLAVPLLVDPIVLFYNRDILAAAGFANPPKLWAELYDMAPEIIRIEGGQVIRQELIPFGQYKNVHNAWAILSTLFLQSRVPIAKVSSLGTKSVNISNSEIQDVAEAGAQVVEFYTQFSNPESEFYTWNRSMLDSKREFIEGRLAFLPSFGSEAKDIRDRNPNLNFAVSSIPQLNTNPAFTATYGNIYVASIVKKSQNILGAYTVLFDFANEDFQKSLAQGTMMAPALSSAIMTPPETTYLPVVYKSALVAKTWYNSDMNLANNVFAQLIENVISGKLNISQALTQAERALNEQSF